MEVLLVGVLGVVLGWLLNELLPWLRDRARSPLRVHIETDLAIVHAGTPDWTGYGFVVPGDGNSEVGAPPDRPCRNWCSWARELGAHDAWQTEVEVTLQGLSETPVVITGLRAIISERAPISGRHFYCPVGGAEGATRGLDIDLDWDPPHVSFYDEVPLRPSFVLERGEVERFSITARTKHGAYHWTAELLLLVHGKRQVIRIDNDGGPFRTSATTNLPAFEWVSDEGWVEGPSI